jgi:hypothetical protein
MIASVCAEELPVLGVVNRVLGLRLWEFVRDGGEGGIKSHFI